MSATEAGHTTPLGGAASELPADYVRRGMSNAVDDAVELGDILAPRQAAPVPGPSAPPTRVQPTTSAAPAVREPAPPTDRPRPRKSRRQADALAPPQAPPVIRPSVVHVPARLLSLIAAERRRSGRSNGEILIAAIEEGHERLADQQDRTARVGGSLFAARVSTPRPPGSEPLSPLNVRLYEQDYDVLDRLVGELGVGSRSRLATMALAHYLDAATPTAPPPDHSDRDD